MGYDVHITRKDEWFTEEGAEISLDEWKLYVESDPEMRLDNFAEAETPDGILRVESEGISVWIGYSCHEVDGNMAWFDYFEGNVKVKNPDEEILKKMFSIAQTLNARVQGDECEFYDEKGQSNWQELKEKSEAMRANASKKWWQFWK
jgi:hypothetical protein